MTKMSDAQVPNLTLEEILSDGSTLSNPAADHRRLFLGEDGLLHLKDSSGTVTDVGGGGGDVATDSIWDAAGDLAVGTGADTAAKLSIGSTDGMVVQRVSGVVAWALPYGHQFDYAEITSSATSTATSEATATALITGGAVTYDGSTKIKIEAWFPWIVPPSGAVHNANTVLYDGSSSLGQLNLASWNPSVTVRPPSLYVVRYLTPSAASHTYSIRGYVDSGTGTWACGVGGSGAPMPAWMRITKA